MQGEVWPYEGVEVVWGRCGGGGDSEGEIRSGRSETDDDMQRRAGHDCGREEGVDNLQFSRLQTYIEGLSGHTYVIDNLHLT